MGLYDVSLQYLLSRDAALIPGDGVRPGASYEQSAAATLCLSKQLFRLLPNNIVQKAVHGEKTAFSIVF